MQRVVLEHTQGPHRGMHQILGNAAELTLGGRLLPEYLPRNEFMG